MSRRGYIFIIGILVGFVLSQQYYTNKLISQHEKYVSVLTEKSKVENTSIDSVLTIKVTDITSEVENALRSEFSREKPQEVHNHITNIHNTTLVVDTVSNLKNQDYGLEVAYSESQ